jgi:hypothetical protein
LEITRFGSGNTRTCDRTTGTGDFCNWFQLVPYHQSPSTPNRELVVARKAVNPARDGAWRLDIIESIAAMDADVITIETSRSSMELLDAFDRFEYPNEIGPGVYDIHSPNVPSEQQIVDLMNKAAERIPAERLWVNPDCGLKTRNWDEVLPALQNMVAAARRLRAEHGAGAVRA